MSSAGLRERSGPAPSLSTRVQTRVRTQVSSAVGAHGRVCAWGRTRVCAQGPSDGGARGHTHTCLLRATRVESGGSALCCHQGLTLSYDLEKQPLGPPAPHAHGRGSCELRQDLPRGLWAPRGRGADGFLGPLPHAGRIDAPALLGPCLTTRQPQREQASTQLRGCRGPTGGRRACWEPRTRPESGPRCGQCGCQHTPGWTLGRQGGLGSGTQSPLPVEFSQNPISKLSTKQQIQGKKWKTAGNVDNVTHFFFLKKKKIKIVSQTSSFSRQCYFRRRVLMA